MSTQTTTTYDVFLSYPLTEAGLAAQVARTLKEVGLDVFWHDGVEAGESFQDTIWRATAESAALIVIVPTESPLTSSVAVEVGAFKAWQKPIYVIQAARGSIKLPAFLAGCPVYPLSRVDDVVESIKRGLASLSEDDRDVLVTIYHEMGIPVDQLLVKPASIEMLAREFRTKSGKMASGERLVRELLTLRKRGNLPRRRG
ncbi:MAG: toll/interleukin-1 receptor domain-containing protein [Planctomycetes bacterium]|nr:toll/interleukin-1 receptor domain-containing protein [Planctomycetota bacterium]MBU4400924.1 toll/interleukin-1 receptor domain-containing protein [Planctomycetota bacterium]MCG2682460.1 toll/interleukin-1 receptor domain-containing protein [Planctomycetales bacterium]